MANASKFLALILRHQPERIGLELDRGGWASVEELVHKAQAHGVKITLDDVRLAVRDNDKQRYALSEDGARIRAVQGHSIPVQLDLEPLPPPSTLFHGTATRFLESILAQGLLPRGRQHVHLSADRQTAKTVGQRHGKPVLLVVDAEAMSLQGIRFFRSENGVWLTACVPAEFLTVRDEL